MFYRCLYLLLFCLLAATVPARAEIKILQVFGASSASDCDGEIEVLTTGSAAPFQLWLEQGGTVVKKSGLVEGRYRFKDVCAGQYVVGVYNALGCRVDLDVTVLNCNNNTWSIQGLVAPSCEPQNNGSINASITGSGAVAPFQYFWSHGPVGTPNVSGLRPGDYGLIAIDARGCRETKVFEVPASTVEVADYYFVFPTTDRVNILLSTTTTHPPLHYLWSNGATTKDLSNVVPGLYQVTVTNVAGCSTTRTYNPAACGNRNLKISIDPLLLTTSNIPLTVSGGNVPLAFHWEGPNGFTASVQSPAIGAAGDYCVTVTDACHQGAVLCQKVSCKGGEFVSINAQNRCLDFNPPGQWGNGAITAHVTTNDPLLCADKMFIKFQNEAWEPLTNNWTHQITGGGTFCVSVKNACGCVVIPQKCFHFSNNDVEVVGFFQENIGNLTSAYYDGSLQVINQCFSCEICAEGVTNLPDPFLPAYCSNSAVFSPMTYQPASAESEPCKGGQITCNGLTLDVPPWAIGVELVDWNAPPVQASINGGCIYPSGCLFIGNTFVEPPLPPFEHTDPPGDRFVYVTNPNGHLVASGNCAPPRCTEDDIIRDPAGTQHPTEPCLVRLICASTGAPVGWIGTGTLCKCYDSDCECFVVEHCIYGEAVPCAGGPEVNLISLCSNYQELYPGQLLNMYDCFGHDRNECRPGGPVLEQRDAGRSVEVSVEGNPNPFQNSVYLTVQSTAPLQTRLIIYNQYGQLVQRWPAQLCEGNLRFQVETETFADGVYYFAVVFDNGKRIGLPLIKVSR